jgi:uncharacterized protein (DUF342 family)
MSIVVIYNDEYLRISSENKDVYLETFRKGFEINQLSNILAQHPEINLTNVNVLRNSIAKAPVQPQIIGELKERIQLEISPDGLTATITFNMPLSELQEASRDKLVQETVALLSRKEIVHGINLSIFKEKLEAGKPYIIAKGTKAIDGSDAIVKMYELMESKPEIRVDGKVDFYDLKLINRVNPGDWLGERIEPTEGTPGKTVKGELIPPAKGKTVPLHYDRNTVKEVSIPGKTVLYSHLSGAVNYSDGKIAVSNHLEIKGDVGISTGNIKFDGYLTINGTILDGFSVEATKDIEINGNYGISNVKNLVSTEGSIYVKGGVSARERIEIRAAKNIFVKFADNVKIVCGETAHIGYYSINSDIIAKNVVFDSSNSRVIGGSIKSEIRVSVPYCGSDKERRTTIEVKGFNRQALVERLEQVLNELSMKRLEQKKIKQYSMSDSEYGPSSSGVSDNLFRIKEDIKMLEEERKALSLYLKTKGNGEVEISKRIYPNCAIILGGNTIEITEPLMSITFILKDGEIITK